MLQKLQCKKSFARDESLLATGAVAVHDEVSLDLDGTTFAGNLAGPLYNFNADYSADYQEVEVYGLGGKHAATTLFYLFLCAQTTVKYVCTRDKRYLNPFLLHFRNP